MQIKILFYSRIVVKNGRSWQLPIWSMQLDELKQRSTYGWRHIRCQKAIPNPYKQLLQLHRQLVLQIPPNWCENKKQAFSLGGTFDRGRDAGLATLCQDRKKQQIRLHAIEMALVLVAFQLTAHFSQKPHECRETSPVSRFNASEQLVTLLVPLLASVCQRFDEGVRFFAFDNRHTYLNQWKH